MAYHEDIDPCQCCARCHPDCNLSFPMTQGEKKHPGGGKNIFFIVVYMIWCVYNDCHNLQHLSSNKQRGTGQEIGRSESARPIPGFRAGAPSFWPIDIRFALQAAKTRGSQKIFTPVAIQTRQRSSTTSLKKMCPIFLYGTPAGPKWCYCSVAHIIYIGSLKLGISMDNHGISMVFFIPVIQPPRNPPVNVTKNDGKTHHFS